MKHMHQISGSSKFFYMTSPFYFP